MSDKNQTDQTSGRRPPRVAWFAGADLRLLALAQSAWTFYSALGTYVLLLACASGMAMAVALGYMLQVSAWYMLPLGLGWAAIVATALERLVLQLPSRRSWWLVLALAWRFALTLLLAIQIGEPLMLRINQGAIQNELSIQRVNSLKAARDTATANYQPRINADTDQIAQIRSHENELRGEVEHFRFLSACEDNTPGCSTTHKLGCSTYCQHYSRLATQKEAELQRLIPLDKKQISQLNAEISKYRGYIAAAVGARTTGIDGNNDLLAREHALATLEKQQPEVAAEVWFLRAFWLVLDLLPLVSRLLRILSMDCPYEAILAAARKRDAIEGLRISEAARVEQHRITEQARADIDVNTVKINVEKVRRIDEAEGIVSADIRQPSTTKPADQEIPAWSLKAFVDNMSSHENTKVAVPAGLRRGGLVGLALVTALTTATLLWTLGMHHALNAIWLPVVGLVLVGLLAGYTRLFTKAPRWALPATLGALFTGLLLPVALITLNL